LKAVIFAAGTSTRTHPLTLTRPKPLLPVANRPILAHQLEALSGIVDEVILVVGYRADMIRERFGDSHNCMGLRYVEQAEQRGTGHALLQCAPILDEPFLAMNGDDLYASEDLRKLSTLEQGALAKEIEDPRQFGVYEVDSEGFAVQIIEKPIEPISYLANIGVYKFEPSVFPILESTGTSPRGEIEITSAIQVLAEIGDFRVLSIEGHWIPIGFAWDLLEANAFLLERFETSAIDGEVSRLADLSGKISIGEGSVIKAGAVIEGPVSIGKNSHIGPNCWIRPATSVGDGCKVGQGVEVKNSIIMDGAAVPHLSYVGDSVIGADANLGCGTITANFRHDGKNHQSMIKGELVDTGRRKFGTIVGDGVHTGINTSIYPGRKLWPGTSTLPGEIVQSDIKN
jgi:bifunctional UDP-N-acetylglucosamine pyrophosphorylase/glucosamine-1-phosphate N-acetyltransferase